MASTTTTTTSTSSCVGSNNNNNNNNNTASNNNAPLGGGGGGGTTHNDNLVISSSKSSSLSSSTKTKKKNTFIDNINNTNWKENQLNIIHQKKNSSNTFRPSYQEDLPWDEYNYGGDEITLIIKKPEHHDKKRRHSPSMLSIDAVVDEPDHKKRRPNPTSTTSIIGAPAVVATRGSRDTVFKDITKDVALSTTSSSTEDVVVAYHHRRTNGVGLINRPTDGDIKETWKKLNEIHYTFNQKKQQG